MKSAHSFYKVFDTQWKLKPLRIALSTTITGKLELHIFPADGTDFTSVSKPLKLFIPKNREAGKR